MVYYITIGDHLNLRCLSSHLKEEHNRKFQPPNLVVGYSGLRSPHVETMQELWR
jgi:hypothetical protein